MRVTGLLGLVGFLVVLVPLGAGENAKLDPARITGTWVYVSGVKDGNKLAADNLKGTVEITKNTITLQGDQGKFVLKYTLDTAKNPCRISMEITEGPQGQGSKAEGIIGLKKDQLILCYHPMGGEAPKDFAAKEGSGHHLFILGKKK
jgi:uncharacterized protein (TIGR03067 family)